MDINKMNKALQMNKLLQLNLSTMALDDEKTMEFADLYPVYQINFNYKKDDIFSYGVNNDGETQLYRVVSVHTSQEDWKPSELPALYTAIGFDEQGYPIWTQPLGAHDAYNKGDIVKHKNQLWISTTDGNVWEPGVYGWETYQDEKVAIL